ncbi:flavin-containing monooxygenase [Allosaccharopolyspora coralli]|uniref:flavin-containing monooxygenase n=1 Tax=Allosaccharopolyspora coralli TaxID=2665642 RepID=UPI001E48AC9C|nr:NAD(P)/FAD-dependent oxidoreductase [Allosaccharopolyspora coralli]
MTSTESRELSDDPDTEHVDVLVVGAGVSGIGAARRLQQECPSKSFAVLERRAALGGTWDLFRYPGVRSDSDIYTLSYPFRPWRGSRSIVDGASIRDYIGDTAREHGIDRHIRYSTKVVSAHWSSEQARWTVETRTGEHGERRVYRCSFLYMCTGYYDYDKGHQPEFDGLDEFEGSLVHPQFWPENLDFEGKRVAIVGSGATAVTLVPAMAEKAAHVTMVQRSPSYITVLPSVDGVADKLRTYLPARVAHPVIRAKNAVVALGFYQFCRRFPERAKTFLRDQAVRYLGDESYVDTHFAPNYQPWDQRLCVIPDGDFYRTLRSGRASVVTDTIDRFVPSGIRTSSGDVVEADIVVSATGLSLLPFGGLELSVDGEPVDISDTVVYRGVMLSGVPNFACCVGYTNASWTLRADLSSRYVCRMVNYLDARGFAAATPRPPGGMVRKPMLDLDANYIKRSIDRFPSQGDRSPWRVRQNYLLDKLEMSRPGPARDMAFTRHGTSSHRRNLEGAR